MNPPTVLFRVDRDNADEYEVARRHMPVARRRTACEKSLVVGRYSVLPFYRELEADLTDRSCRLVNTAEQHNWIASFDYYRDLIEDVELGPGVTAATWTSLAETDHPGPFVVKGRTNSRKYQWATHMYAETRADALRVAGELANDGFIGLQELVFREYVPLVTYDVGLNGIRYTNEWRFFYYKQHRLAYGYYWATATRPEVAEIDATGLDFADHLARRVANHVPFFVLDVAQKEDGRWILIEINDAQMSGLPHGDHVADDLYRNLAATLRKEGGS